MSIWFKQLKVFQYQVSEALQAETFEQVLQSRMLQPCPSVSLSSSGWTSPFGRHSEVMLHATQNFWLLCFAKEERLLPASVLREQVDNKIEEIQAKQERKVYAKEKANIREDVQFQLLPQAFTRKQKTFMFFDIKSELLYISTTNETRCQQIIELLDETLGGFKAYPVEMQKKMSTIMTDWVRDDRWPQGFIIERDCEMFDEDHEKSIIKFQQQNLAAKEVIEHLNKGNKLSKLSMSWQDKIGFTIDTKFNLSRIKFLDLLDQQRQDQFCDSPEQQLDVDFTIMAMEFALLIPELSSLFGGMKPLNDIHAPVVADTDAPVPA